MVLTAYGKQMSQYFREPPEVEQKLPLKVNSRSHEGSQSWPRTL